MHNIEVKNVHTALPELLYQVARVGERRDSRNGPVLKFPKPVCVEYARPRERVMLWSQRDANPFFHFFESLWMLAGRNDVAFVKKFNNNISGYSDNQVTFHGAYGHRWRRHFNHDQLPELARILRTNKDDRRCVLQMWDADVDLGHEGLDFPCNTQAYLAVNNGLLDLTVCNRSNDIVWGALGANAVHFSFMQEVMASWIGVPVGRYYQFSNNMHIYTSTHQKLIDVMDGMEAAFDRKVSDPYSDIRGFAPFPIVENIEDWMHDLQMFIDDEPGTFEERFFNRVVLPMQRAWEEYKRRSYVNALNLTNDIEATDWQRACKEWIMRRAFAATQRA